MLTTPVAASPLPVKGAEPGHDRSSGPVVPGEELVRKGQRGLQGTLADHQSRISGGRWMEIRPAGIFV